MVSEYTVQLLNDGDGYNKRVECTTVDLGSLTMYDCFHTTDTAVSK